MKKFVFFILWLTIGLGSNFWYYGCSNGGETNGKGNFIDKENVRIFVDDQWVNYINPTSDLRFEKGAYGEYKIIDISVTFGEKVPPITIPLPNGDGGTIKVKTNSAEIFIRQGVDIKIGNQVWNPVTVKGVFDNEARSCTINIQFGKNQ